MKSNSQAFFEKVCARRMRSYLEVGKSSALDQEQAEYLAQLMTVLDQTCGKFRLKLPLLLSWTE